MSGVPTCFALLAVTRRPAVPGPDVLPGTLLAPHRRRRHVPLYALRQHGRCRRDLPAVPCHGVLILVVVVPALVIYSSRCRPDSPVRLFAEPLRGRRPTVRNGTTRCRGRPAAGGVCCCRCSCPVVLAVGRRARLMGWCAAVGKLSRVRLLAPRGCQR